MLVIYPGFRMAVAYLDLFPTQDGRTTWWSLWAVVLVGHLICAAVVLAAIASETGGLASVGLDIAVFVEELAYRGYAITRLRGLFGLPIAVIASIVAFALMHGPSAFIPQF